MNTDSNEGNFITGTPPMLLLPAKNFAFKIENEHFIIELPRKGRYVDLAPEIFTEEDGEFNIFDEESRTFFTPSITKVLFATKKYPDLKYNQFFVPYAIHIEDDKVILVGQVVDMLIAVKDEEPEED